jgi:two-component system, OmpR family, sensor histidine kinase KdpD
MARGTLRIFLGAAPGVGKTYEMLQEAHRLGGRGEDVAVAFAADHGRSDTRALLDGLEVIPPRRLRTRGTEFEEMDLDAVLARAPGAAVVDEYAHSNVPGSRNPKRWQDVDELLNAGINVLSTVNIQHLASLGDVVSAITDVGQAGAVPGEVPDEALLGESVPDDVVRRADQIDLVDIPPELLRQRLSDGKIYAADNIDAALSNYFRLGNLSALRELSLLWLADRVDEGLAKYRAEHGIHGNWPARERIVVGLTGGPEGEALIRRAARILTRVSGGDLLAVHVRVADGVSSESPQALERQRRLTLDLGGSYHIVAGEDPAPALLDFARSVNATQIVVGISRRKNLAALLGGFLGGGVGTRVVRDSGDIDVHMVPHALGGQGSGVPRPRDLGRARVVVGFVLAVLVPVLLQLLLALLNPEQNIATAMLVQLSGSVAVALVGGLWPAVLAALWSSLLVNYFSTPPTGHLIISDPQNFLALFVFLGVSAAVALVVDLAARRSKEAARARAEAATLSDLTRGAAGSEDTVEALLDQARTVFQVSGTALFSRGGDGTWQPLASAGQVPEGAVRQDTGRQDTGRQGPATDGSPDGENVEEIDAGTRLVLYGRILPASDRRLLAAFGVHLAAQRERQQLMASQREMMRLAESNTMRTSILRAVSHDLRTPLAGIKLAVGALRGTGVRYTPQEEQELLATIEECSDRLDVLVGNLLDMSRITSDSASPHLRPLRWYEVLPGALHGVPPGRVRVELPANMPEVDADQGMLERVVANIVENAVKYAPDSDIVVVGAAGGLGPATLGGRPAGELRIIDHGRGVPAERVLDMFRPFQRLDDASRAAGVGLGLAVAKGFTEAMGGRLAAEPTPGGGLTMAISLPLSTGAPVDAGPGRAPLAPSPSGQDAP